MSYRSPHLFREQARRSVDENGRQGRPLRLTPAWVSWTYWLLVSVGVAGLLLSALADLGEYARGPAVVRLQGRTQVTAVQPGVVAEVLIEPGQRVDAGQVLVRMHDDVERAELLRLEQELQAELHKLLRKPDSEAHRAKIAQLQADEQLAKVRVTQRVVRAPHAGVISDARIRPGQRMEAGEVLLTLVGAEAKREVLAMLPGHYRPLLQPGMVLHLELAGYHQAAQQLEIETIGDEVIGPAAVQRFLGADRADAVAVQGPVVLVRARLPGPMFEISGRRYPYFDGMAGQAHARVRSQSILTTLVPGLQTLSEMP